MLGNILSSFNPVRKPAVGPPPCVPQVRAVAGSALEREERALQHLERDVADREARSGSREKLLAEREARVAAREKEADAMRAELQNLIITLETNVQHDR